MRSSFLLSLYFILLYSCSDGLSETASGFKYRIFPSSSPGDTIKLHDVVKVQLYQYADDSLLSSTVGKMPQYIEVNNELRKYEFTELLKGMRVNDSAACYFEVEDIMKRAGKDAKLPKELENRKQVRVYFRILEKFSSEAEALFDVEKTQKSLVELTGLDEKEGFSMANRIFDSLLKTLPVPTLPLEGGVHVMIREKGDGIKLKAGQEIGVIYKGMLVNGKVFEERTMEDPLVMHVAMGEVSRGFDVAIASLSVGDKAMVYIPAEMAYGAKKVGEYIPAFSNLVFEVEIRDLTSSNKRF